MITITDTELEAVLKKMLQRKVDFVIKKKQWRSGKLLIFKQNGFFIEFTIKNNKDKVERFEVPIPFDINFNSDSVGFSYELTKLVCNKPTVIEEIKKIEPKCNSKYYDSYLEIHIS